MAGTLGKPTSRGDGKQCQREDASIVKMGCSGRRGAHVMCAGSQAGKRFHGN